MHLGAYLHIYFSSIVALLAVDILLSFILYVGRTGGRRFHPSRIRMIDSYVGRFFSFASGIGGRFGYLTQDDR